MRIDECSGDTLIFKIIITDFKTVVTRNVNEPINNFKHRKCHITFKDDIKEIMNKKILKGKFYYITKKM